MYIAPFILLRVLNICSLYDFKWLLIAIFDFLYRIKQRLVIRIIYVRKKKNDSSRKRKETIGEIRKS